MVTPTQDQPEPSGSCVAQSQLILSRFAPVRTAAVRSTWSRSAAVNLVPVRTAPVRTAPVRSAPPKLNLERVAQLGYAGHQALDAIAERAKTPHKPS